MAESFRTAASLPLLLGNRLGHCLAKKCFHKKHFSNHFLHTTGWVFNCCISILGYSNTNTQTKSPKNKYMLTFCSCNLTMLGKVCLRRNDFLFFQTQRDRNR